MAVLAGQQALTHYPVDIEVDGPHPQSRLTVLFRFLLIIPHVIALYFLGILSGIVTLVAWFAIVITGSHSAGMSKLSTDILHWSIRATAYTYLLTDKYPPFSMGDDATYPVRMQLQPQLTGRNRLTVFLRIFMLIPHLIVLYIFQILAGVVHFIAFWVALFTGSVPAGMHNFLAGVLRYYLRYSAYALLLVDDYPPFGTN